MSVTKTSAKASAPAKIILFGEHFVVYDNPAILASIDRRIHVSVYLNKTKNINIRSDLEITDSYKSSKLKLINRKKNRELIFYPLYKLIKSILSKNNENMGIDVDIRSEIPFGIGLGSSAACCVAVSGAVKSLFHEPDRQQIYSIAAESERVIHQNSSGADCYVSTFGGLIYYIKNKALNKIKSPKKLSLIIVNTRIKHSTGSLVSSVKEYQSKNRILFKDLSHSAYDICQSALYAIKTGNEKRLGTLMNENHKLLQDIGVSHKKINEIVDLCIKNGAFGAKLTGAGGGGSIIALLPKRDTNDIILEIEKNGWECMPVKIDYGGMRIY
jgi:mevalonate kinase